MRFAIPLRVRSSQNLREHWAAKAKRVKAERHAVGMYYLVAESQRRARGEAMPSLPLVVSLTRVGPRLFDDDNNVSSLKGCRDEIAEMLGVDDGDPRVKWIYDQRIGRAYSVEVEIVDRRWICSKLPTALDAGPP